MTLHVKDLLPGDLLLSPPPPLTHGWAGQAIVLLTKGTTSHAAIYYGIVDDVPQIVHSYLDGVVFLELKKHFEQDATPHCIVRRHTPAVDLTAVLKAAKTYANQDNPLPKYAFGVLAVVILAKKLSEKKLHSREFFDFTVLFCNLMVSLFKISDTQRHQLNRMHCSQLVAKCYADAGLKINFNNLILDYQGEGLLPGSKSLSDFIRKAQDNQQLIKSEPTLPPIDAAGENRIVSSFFEMMERGDNEKTEDSVSDAELLNIGLYLAQLTSVVDLLSQPKSSQQPENLTAAYPNPFLDRYYYILPDDLLYNTQDFIKIGKICDAD